MNVENILDERGSRYGEFKDHASISQSLKLLINLEITKRAKILQNDQQEALEMICHKIARIINGDPNYADSWIDIAGYATLIANRLNQK